MPDAELLRDGHMPGSGDSPEPAEAVKGGAVMRQLAGMTDGGIVLRREPNFLIIGAGKSGTTSLWNQLRQHPDIFMHTSKHLNFFDETNDGYPFRGPPPNYQLHHVARTWDSYCAEFAAAAGRRAVGEACNSYLYSPGAAEQIRKRLPDARLIALLRHPAERAFSRYLQLRRSRREPLEFGPALRAEAARIAENWWPDFHYLHAGLYHQQLSRYLARFPRHQLRIYLQEDLAAEPQRVLRDIFAFLEVSDCFLPKTDVRYSPSGLPRSRTVDWALRHLRSARPLAERLLREREFDYLMRVAGKAHARNLIRPRIDLQERAWMIERYRDDTLKLQDLIGRDLSAWLV